MRDDKRVSQSSCDRCGKLSAFERPDATVRFLQGQLTDVKAVAIVYETLLGGVPASDFFQFRISENIKTNYGGLPVIPASGSEAVYVNVAASLIRDSSVAAAQFGDIASGLSLREMVSSIYSKNVPLARQSVDGLAYLVRDEAIQFYRDAADARGLGGDFGAAIVAFGALANILVESRVGKGDAASDLARSIVDGNSQLPSQSLALLPLETVDGTAYDADDALAFASLPAPAPVLPA